MPKAIPKLNSKRPAKTQSGAARLNLDAFLPYRLSLASNQVSDLIARTYRDRYKITVSEWRLISILGERGASTPMTPMMLVQVSKMDKVTVSRAAIALLKNGMVFKLANPGDGRSHHLVLTAKGARLYRDVVPRVKIIEQTLLDGFTRAEVAALSELLRRLEKAAADQLKPD